MFKIVITSSDIIGIIIVGLFLFSILYLYIAGKIYDHKTQKNINKLKDTGFVLNETTKNFERGNEVLDNDILYKCNYSYRRYKKLTGADRR